MDEWRAERIEELRSQVVDNSSDDITDGPEGWESEFRRRRRGAMRQVGAQGLLAAIECPEWALLLIYEPVSFVFARLVKYSGIGLLILFAVYNHVLSSYSCSYAKDRCQIIGRYHREQVNSYQGCVINGAETRNRYNVIETRYRDRIVSLVR